jgi:hypothetical protein
MISLLLAVLFCIASSNVFAFSKPAAKFDSDQEHYLQTNQNTGAALIVEITFSKNFNAEDPFFSPSANSNSSFYAEKTILAPLQGNLFFRLSDRRKLILQQIYPFHFFW